MEAYKKRSKWAQFNSKNMDELLNNEGTVNKLYHIAIMQNSKVIKENKMNHMKRTPRHILRKEKN